MNCFTRDDLPVDAVNHIQCKHDRKLNGTERKSRDGIPRNQKPSIDVQSAHDEEKCTAGEYIPTDRDPNTAIFLLFTDAAAAFVADIFEISVSCIISGLCLEQGQRASSGLLSNRTASRYLTTRSNHVIPHYSDLSAFAEVRRTQVGGHSSFFGACGRCPQNFLNTRSDLFTTIWSLRHMQSAIVTYYQSIYSQHPNRP